jgi:hypothetical protein
LAFIRAIGGPFFDLVFPANRANGREYCEVGLHFFWSIRGTWSIRAGIRGTGEGALCKAHR